MLFVGIDVGKDGALVALREGSLFVALRTASHFTRPSRKGGPRDYDRRKMVSALQHLLHPSPEGGVVVAIELPEPRGGEGAKSSFSSGYGFGLWLGIMAALPFPEPLLAKPSIWTRELFRGRKEPGKERAIALVRERLPELNLQPGRLESPHTGLADAACLAFWARQQTGSG